MTRRILAGLAASALVLGVSCAQQHRVAVRCFAERSATVEGVEVVAYPAGVARTQLGVEVRCPR